MPRSLLVFDLDETLVHARQDALATPELLRFGPYYVYLRPHARELLEHASERFDLGIWSAATADYVAKVAHLLSPDRNLFRFVWSVERCVQRVDHASNGYIYIKDLRKLQALGYALSTIRMIDDSPEKVRRQPHNHIRVKPYTGDPADRELLALAVSLDKLQ